MWPQHALAAQLRSTDSGKSVGKKWDAGCSASRFGAPPPVGGKHRIGCTKVMYPPPSMPLERLPILSCYDVSGQMSTCF